MEAKTFFLSHSKEDKEIVLEVAKKLGEKDCWIYEWESRAGGSIFSYDKGLGDSRVFVLFWSKNASESPFVEDEVNQARIRSMRERGYRLVAIRLDETELPCFLQYRIYLDIVKGLEYIVRRLFEVKKDLTPEAKLVGSKGFIEIFQDREDILSKLEEIAQSQEYNGILITGLEGIGKTWVIKRSITKVFPNSVPIWVNLYPVTSPIRLITNIAKPLSIAIDIEEIGRDPIGFWQHKLYPEIAESLNTLLILEDLSLPETYNSVINELIERVISDILKLDKSIALNPNIIISTKNVPNISEQNLAKMFNIRVRSLDDKSMVRALRYKLSRITGIDYEISKIEQLARELHGYPIALNIVASRVNEQGIDAVLADRLGLKEQLIDLIRGILDGYSFSGKEKNILLYLAIAQKPLEYNVIKSLKGFDKKSFELVARKQLFEIIDDKYSLHPLIGYYVLDALTRPEQTKDAHSELANIYKVLWQDSEPKTAASAEYGYLTCYHLIASGRDLEKTYLIQAYKYEVRDAAIELYRLGYYEDALDRLKKVRDIFGTDDPQVEFYYALSLNRCDKGEEALDIIKILIKGYPDDPYYYHGLGGILRNLGKKKEAIEAYRQSVIKSKNKYHKVSALSSLADLLIDERRIKDAEPLIKEAYAINPSNSFAVNVMSKFYEKIGEIDSAIAVLKKALKKSPNDTRLHARVGYLLKKMGKLSEAREHLEYVRDDPQGYLHLPTLADLYIRLGEYEEAEKIISGYRGRIHDDATYLSVAGNIARHKGEYEKAEHDLSRAVKIEPDNPIHYGGLAQLYIEIAKIKHQEGDRENFLIYLGKADDYVNRGLKVGVEHENEALLSIRNEISNLRG